MKKVMKMFVVLCLLLCTGCTQVRNKVTYTVYPIGYLIQRISTGTVQYQSIQESDVIVQRAVISKQYQDTLSHARVLFHIGSLEPYYTIYEKHIKDYASKVIDLSSMSAIYDFKRYTLEEDENGNAAFTEAPYYTDYVFDTIDTNQKDLSLWIEPIAMLSMGKTIRDWFIETYPNNKELYEKNFNNLETELIDLDSQFQSFSTEIAKSGKRLRFVTMTASFGNWQKTYGFEVYPVILSKYGVLPTQSQLEAIKKRIREDDVKYIAYEANMTEEMTALYEEIRDELGLTPIYLSNLSSLSESEAEAGKDYLSIMYENLNVLQNIGKEVLGETDE